MPVPTRSIFDIVFGAVQRFSPTLAAQLRRLALFRAARLAGPEQAIQAAATDFMTVEEVATTFNLQWKLEGKQLSPSHRGAIEEEVPNDRPPNETVTSADVELLLSLYIKLFLRGSEAICRLAIDLVILGVFSVLRRSETAAQSPTQNYRDIRGGWLHAPADIFYLPQYNHPRSC